MEGRRILMLMLLALAALPVLAPADGLVDRIILPEQRSLDLRDPSSFAQIPLPPATLPRTVAQAQACTEPWNLSLDDAIRIALENAKVIRVLAGLTAVNSGRTIYDAAIVNTTIDQEQAAFDPVLSNRLSWNRNEDPQAIFDPFAPDATLIVGTRIDDFRNDFQIAQKNLLGGTFSVDWFENPARFYGFGPFPLNPQKSNAVAVNYTQPLLQGAGPAVNLAPIVIARLQTQRSFFQFKGSTQDLVRGVIEAYWNLVFARTELWARGIQLQLSKEAFEREEARFQQRMAAIGDLAQAKVTYNQFRASQIAAQANVLNREAVLRNLLGLPPNDCREIIPVSYPTNRRFEHNWNTLTALAAERRPDLVELKIILEADEQRILIARNQALPRLDAFGTYRWNGLEGEMPSGSSVFAGNGKFTDWTMGLNFSVPLGLRRERAQVREQELLIARDRANLEQGLHAASHQLALTLRNLDSNYLIYEAQKVTREAALTNLEVQNAQFRVGRVIYLNVLQALFDWGNSVITEAQALVNYNIELANLERETGTILETHGIFFYEERWQFAGPLRICGQECYYPAGQPLVGPDGRYPAKEKPAENFFDLKNPTDQRRREPPVPIPPPSAGKATSPVVQVRYD